MIRRMMPFAVGALCGGAIAFLEAFCGLWGALAGSSIMFVAGLYVTHLMWRHFKENP